MWNWARPGKFWREPFVTAAKPSDDSPLSAQIADVNLLDGEEYRVSRTQRVAKCLIIDECLRMQTPGILPAYFESAAIVMAGTSKAEVLHPISGLAVSVLSHRW